MSTFKILIIGAGTGGMCLAHGLRRAGFEVAVHERDRTRTGGLHGYRVGISPNGARALRACLDDELFGTFVATTGRAYVHLTMYTEHFSELVGMCFDDLPHGEAAEDQDYNVSRTTLRQVLFTGMEDVITFDRVFTGYEQHEDGTVTAFFADGSSDRGDLLVGADGANSRVRAQYLPHATHSETGLVAIGGKLPFDAVQAAALPERVRSGMSMLFDRRGQFGILHAMRMPWEPGGAPREGIGSDDAALLAAWPGLRYDNTTDYVSWGLSTSRRVTPADVLDRRGTALHDVAADLTRDWDPRWRDLLAASDPSAALAVSVRTSDPLPAWRPSSVTLVGDAIHTMTPGRGAGANTALRDARELRDRLVRMRDGELSRDEAVGSYEEHMRRYSALAVRESLEFMHDDVDRRPLLRPFSVLAQRSAMRVVNHVPAAKRRMARGLQKVRDSELV
ncbi:FAD-dependent monooxygenase [Actinomycetospora endophytica]|uniref:FAD-dependent monooxygenase n=1 Tax=Actinomycetospora endophytica TaxID=2291215 RepID=A0ABS8P6J2_9PSEU|nr:FAD-dependent monooxygenase [Actinomycetospora endophytica]MCD2193175.1 FAD-dependent monooxygenase [Actinomycetospora endophytica]